MRRLLALALLLAWPASAQYARNVTAETVNVDGSDAGTSYSTTPAPTGCASGMVPYFDASFRLVCSPTVYAPSTDTTTSTGTIAARNLTATALATPGAITVTPVLTQTGTINVVAGASLVDGDYFTIEYEAGLTIPIEFDASPGNGTTGGRIPCVFAPGDSAGTIRDALIVLINAVAPTKVVASIGGAAAITVTRTPPGSTGVSITENVANAGFTVVNWGVTAATTYTYKLVWRLPDGTTTEAGAASSTAAGHATLSTANRNDLSWTAGPSGSVTDVYKTVGGTTGKIATGITATTLSDTGLAGAGETPPTVNGTGVVTAERVLVGNGTAAAPSVAFAGSPTTGFVLAAGPTLDTYVSGVFSSRLTSATLVTPNAIAIGANQDVTLTRAAAATLQLGAAASGTPVAQTLQAQGATGTDVAGANLTIRPGAGTGAAAGSSLIFQAPTAGGSSSTAQTYVTRLTLSSGSALFSSSVASTASDGYFLGTSALLWQQLYLTRATLGSKSKAITDGSATAFATFTIADGATYTGEVIYKVKAVQGTALQALAGRARFAATREGSTYTVSISEVGTQTLAAAAGTLTGAIEIGGTGGVVTLSANFNTSLTPTTFTIEPRFDSPDAGLALTFP